MTTKTGSTVEPDALSRAMRVTDQTEADACFDALVAHCMLHCPWLTRDEAIELERRWLVLFSARFCDDETRDRVRQLYRLGGDNGQ